MYYRFYGLKEDAFRLTADPRFLYLSPAHREALSGLVYAVLQAKGLVVLTGPIGSGKTTLLRAALAIFARRQVATVFVSDPLLTREEFFQVILSGLGIEKTPRNKAETLALLQGVLMENAHRGLLTALVIDEAQGLSHELLEQIRLLNNLETQKGKLLHTVLSGQPEFWSRLKQPECQYLKQRVALACQLRPLTEEQTQQYIEQRLQIAGLRDRAVFSEKAMQAIFRFSGGIPRLINTLCEGALQIGYAQNQRLVDCGPVAEAARDHGLIDAVSALGPGEPEEGVLQPRDAAAGPRSLEEFIQLVDRMNVS